MGSKSPTWDLFYQTQTGEKTFQALKYALSVGYRHIDTAKLYGNEGDVGRGVTECGSREMKFCHNKGLEQLQRVWFDSKGTWRHLETPKLYYVDLYIIHWPVRGKIAETWMAMVKILKEGKSRAIGVSNYQMDELRETMKTFDIVPAINQVEFHHFLYQKNLLHFCENNKTHVVAYGPLTRGRRRLDHPIIERVSKKYDRTPAQILIRWCLQHSLG